MNTREKNIKRRTMKIKLFKNNKMNKNFSERLYSPKSNIFRPMSSSNLSHLKNNKLYFLNNKSNKRSFSFQDYEEIGFMNGFRRKKTSKVGNSIYDKINTMLKYRFLKKFKLNSKKYYKNLISNTINQNYKKQKEEAKNNKLVQTFLSENLRTSLTKTTDSDIKILKEKNKMFFNKYSKIVEQNSLLKFRLQDLTNKKNEIHKYLIQLEHNKDKNIIPNENSVNIINNNTLINQDLVNFQSNIYINRKRKRRKKSQIVCKYICTYKDCNKKYATEGALNQHIKFKHTQI